VLHMIPITRAISFLYSIQRLVFILRTDNVLCAVGPKFLFIIQEKVSQIAKLTTPHNFNPIIIMLPTPVAARSEAWVCGRSLAGIAGSNCAGGMDVCLL
jgi:hypothetical protein